MTSGSQRIKGKKTNLRRLAHSPPVNSLPGSPGGCRQSILPLLRWKQRQNQPPPPRPPQPIPEASRLAGAASCHRDQLLMALWADEDKMVVLTHPEKESPPGDGTVGYDPVRLLWVPLRCLGGTPRHSHEGSHPTLSAISSMTVPSTAFLALTAGARQFIDHALALFRSLPLC